MSSPRWARRSEASSDLLVHSVAFADTRDLEGRFTDTPRDRFWLAIDVSAYSLDADDVGAAAFLLSDEAANVTGTTLYVDSGYHAMGI